MSKTVDEAERFKAIRLELKLTQKEMGELCGVTERAIRYWEKGSRHVPQSAWIIILLARQQQDRDKAKAG